MTAKRIVIGLFIFHLLGGVASYIFFLYEETNNITSKGIFTEPYFLDLGHFQVTLKDGKQLHTNIALMLNLAAYDSLQRRIPELEHFILLELQSMETDGILKMDSMQIRENLKKNIHRLLPQNNEPQIYLKVLLINNFYVE